MRRSGGGGGGGSLYLGIKRRYMRIPVITLVGPELRANFSLYTPDAACRCARRVRGITRALAAARRKNLFKNLIENACELLHPRTAAAAAAANIFENHGVRLSLLVVRMCVRSLNLIRGLFCVNVS